MKYNLDGVEYKVDIQRKNNKNIYVRIKEDLTIFALAKCNLILRYYGVKSKKTAEIKIPYLLIRHHTYIPPELLEE